MTFRNSFQVALLALAFCSFGAAQCSLETVRGSWAVYGQLTIMMTVAGSSQPVPVPYAELYVATIDAQGNLSWKGMASVGGMVSGAKGTGTIAIAPDCTGTETFSIEGVPGQGVERLVVLNNGTEVRGMVTTGILGKPIGIEYWRRMSWGDAPVCAENVVHGVYQGTYDGYVMMKTSPDQAQPVPVPVSVIVAAGTDYQGNVAGGGTISVGGTIQDFTFPNSTFQVNPDCTGTVHRNILLKGSSAPLPVQDIDQFVVLNGGEELILLNVQEALGSPIAIGNLKRTGMMPITPAW
jgi:hypothetical protein